MAMNRFTTRDHESAQARRPARSFRSYGSLALCVLCLLSCLTACSSLDLAPKESTAFSFSAPTGQAETTGPAPVAETANSLTGEDQLKESPSQEVSPTEGQVADLEKTETQAQALNHPTNPFSAQARIPLYARLEDAQINDEPAVPVSVPKDNPIRGIAGSRVERFFRTLSVNPVTYHYAVLPSEGDLQDAEDIDALEVYIALKDDMAYMRIDTKDSALALLQLSASTYYQMDFLAGTYEILPGLTTQSNELSMEAFRQLETNAGNFINTGAGPAIFFGQRVNFEEFTADGASYVRYYFVGDVLVGHRRFEDGKIVRTVRVFEASNRYDEEAFQIPAGLKQVSPGETLPDASASPVEVTVPNLNP